MRSGGWLLLTERGFCKQRVARLLTESGQFKQILAWGRRSLLMNDLGPVLWRFLLSLGCGE